MTTQHTDSVPMDHTHSNACWWHPLQARWVCGPAVEPAVEPAVDAPLVDVRDMLVVHTALLREFRLAPGAVRRTAPDDRRQAAVVTGHLRFVCALLHHHHEGEDELLWPLLCERAPSRLREFETGEAQHVGLGAALGDVSRLLDEWALRADADVRDALANRLDELSALLREHLEFEEAELLPVAAAVLSPSEWGAVGAHGAASTPKKAMPLVFGMFAYEGDPAVLALMLRQAPPPVRALLPKIAPAVYARRARRVYGTRRP